MSQLPNQQQPQQQQQPALRPVMGQQPNAPVQTQTQQTGWTVGGVPVTQNPITGQQLPPWQQDAAAMQQQLDTAAQQPGLQPVPQQQTQQPAQQQSMPVVYAEQAPAFLQSFGKEDTGLEDLAQFIIPPRIMVRQPQSDNPEVLSKTQFGDIYLSPELKVLHRLGGEPIPFTPILQYTEFTCQNPRGIKPWIIEQSDDIHGELAKRARNPAVRNSVLCPAAENRPEIQDKYVHYVEHMNFLIMLRIPDAPVTPVLLSYSKTGFFYGKKFSSLIMGRVGPSGVYPLFSGVYKMRTVSQTNDKGTFANIEISNAGFVPTQAEYDMYKQLYMDLRAKKASGDIQTQYEDDATDTANGAQQPGQQPAQGMQQPQQYVDPNQMLNQAANQQQRQGQPGGF